MKRESKSATSSLEHRLNSYALAASAAGVAVLALSQPSEAKIIYRHTHVVIGHNGVSRYNLDLNHDGVTDLTIQWGSDHGQSSSGAGLSAFAAARNAVVGSKSCTSSGSCTNNAAALYRGAKIAPSRAFYGSGRMVSERCFLFTCKPVSGDWNNVTNRYLGLKFMIKGKAHYGWARLSVQVKRISITATLTGYAYETIPNKPIIAGKTKGPDVITVQPASLGHLARGASAMKAWRQKESVGVTH